MPDKTITVGQTLDLTCFISDDINDVKNITDDIVDENVLDNSTFSESLLWTPDDDDVDETYTFNIGEKELSIKVIDVPDSVEHLYDVDEIEASDGENVEWLDVVGDVDFAEASDPNDKPEYAAAGMNDQPTLDFSVGDVGLEATTYDVDEPFVVAFVVEHVGPTSTNNFYWGHPDDRALWQMQDDNDNDIEMYRGESNVTGMVAQTSPAIYRWDCRTDDDRILRDTTLEDTGDFGNENIRKMSLGWRGDGDGNYLDFKISKYGVFDFDSDSELDDDNQIDGLLDDWAEQYGTPTGWV